MKAVAPFAGAWIEIPVIQCAADRHPVAPFAGAWIEIRKNKRIPAKGGVAPFAGAWIEIAQKRTDIRISKSLPSRERGLKYRPGIPDICR